MFNLSPFTLAALALIALFIYGPDKLPKAVGEAARGLRKLRTMFQSATEGVRSELGPEYQDLRLSDLNPRSFVRKHLLEEERTWERPEPLWEPGPKPDGWPTNVPFPSAAEMGMEDGADAFTAPIPRRDTPPTPPPRKPHADDEAQTPVADAPGGQDPAAESGEAREAAHPQA